MHETVHAASAAPSMPLLLLLAPYTKRCVVSKSLFVQFYNLVSLVAEGFWGPSLSGLGMGERQRGRGAEFLPLLPAPLPLLSIVGSFTVNAPSLLSPGLVKVDGSTVQLRDARLLRPS